MVDVLQGGMDMPDENERYARQGLLEVERYLGSVAQFEPVIPQSKRQTLGQYALGDHPPV